MKILDRVLGERVALVAVLCLLATGCGSGGDGSSDPAGDVVDGSPDASNGQSSPDDDLPVVVFSGFPFDVGSMPAVVMNETGLDREHGFIAEYLEVDPEASRNVLLMGESHIAMEQDAVSAAIAQAAGHDVVVFLPNLNQGTGIVVAEDSPYQSLEDLEGERVGHPGIDTGTSGTVALMLDEIHDIDVSESFDLRQAGFAALPGLLEAGEVEGMINTDPFNVLTIESLPGRLLFDSRAAWEERTGGWSPHLTDLAARTDWLQENPDLALSVLEAWEEAVARIVESDYELLAEEAYAELLLKGLPSQEALETYLAYCVDVRCLDTTWDASHIEHLNEYLELTAEQGVFLEAPPSGEVAVVLEEFLQH